MAESGEQMTECPVCEGEGRYAGPKDALVRVRCDRCGGSGLVPADSITDEDRPGKTVRKVPWQQRFRPPQ